MTSSALTSEQLQHLLHAAAENYVPHTPDVFTLNPLTDQVLASLAREQQFARGEIVFAEGAVGEETLSTGWRTIFHRRRLKSAQFCKRCA